MSEILKNDLNKKIISFFLSVCLMLSICFALGLTVHANENDDDGESKVMKVEAEIDYVNEVIVLKNKKTANGNPVYMYSPKASITANAKKQANEKWIAVEGNTIDISKHIPLKSGKESVIAIRFADDIQREDKTYESREVFIIQSRPNVSIGDLKRQVLYDIEDGHIRLIGELKGREYDYQIGNSDWIYKAKGDLDASPQNMPLGGTVTIRLSATDVSFASLSIAIKVPKPLPTPKLKLNFRRGYIIGASNRFGWSAEEDGEYEIFNDKRISFNDFEEKFTNISKFETIVEDEIKYIIVYIKALATNKRPASIAQVLLIPVNEIKGEQEIIEDEDNE